MMNKNYKAYIFDCDGTLVDSMPAHFESWRQALHDCDPSFDFTLKLFHSLAGMGLIHTVEEVNKRYGLSFNPEKVVALKDQYFLQNLDKIRLKDEVVAHVRDMHGKIKLAVASGGNRTVVARILESVGIEKYFDAVVTQDDVLKGKPDPDIFICAAQKLEVPAKDCLVFEDAELGILAAKRAGMDVIKVE